MFVQKVTDLKLLLEETIEIGPMNHSDNTATSQQRQPLIDAQAISHLLLEQFPLVIIVFICI